MMHRIRRPGDQAPPPRAPHRNDHLVTATTHVKDTAGKRYCIHDGSDDKLVLTIEGQLAWNLEYTEARRKKDIAVTRMKQRRASIMEIEPGMEIEDPAGDEELEAFVPEGETLETAQASLSEVTEQIVEALTPEERELVEKRRAEVQDSFRGPDQPLSDPQLEQNRQKLVSAAGGAAAAAQQRAYAAASTKKEAVRLKAAQIAAMPKPKPGEIQRAPGWEAPPPKSKTQNTGKAPGWSAPPKGVSSAKQAAPPKAQGKAPGWDKATGGLTGAAPEFADPKRAPKIELDDPNSKPEESDDDDLMMAPIPDLETDVKTETERAHAAAKKAWESLSEVEQQAMKARILRVVDEGARQTMYAAMEPKQIEEFEIYEAAYQLLFGVPPLPVAKDPQDPPESAS